MRTNLYRSTVVKVSGVVMGVLLCGAMAAQDMPVDRLTVPLSDPSKLVKLSANLVNGGITVSAHGGKEVIVEGQRRSEGTRQGRTSQKAGGMRRIVTGGAGLTVEEEDNVVRVRTSAIHRPVDLNIQVPSRTSLKLRCVNAGNIEVSGVSGEVEANNVNGRITLSDISGIVVAHTVNGDVKAELKAVTPEQPMSFSSLNGDIDVTFPADIKASVKMETDNGDVYTDFDINMQARSREPIVEKNRESGGKYRVKIDKAVYGTINGGGPEFSFKTFNGSIYIRKQ